MQQKHTNDQDALIQPDLEQQHPKQAVQDSLQKAGDTLQNAASQTGENVKEKAEKASDNVQEAVAKAGEEVERSKVPWYRASKRAYALIAFYLIEFVLFTLLAWFVHYHPVLGIDVAITREFQENKAPWLQAFMVAVSYLGNAMYVFVPLILLTALGFWLVKLRLEALLIIVVSVTSSILNVVIKLIVNRPRPNAKLVDIFQHASGLSFPSGHVMAYVAFWGLLFSLGLILFKRDRWWHYALLIIPALFVILVGPSRIYLGDHWASDVLGGYLFGGAWLGIWLWIYLKLKEKGVLSPKLTGHNHLFGWGHRDHS